MQRRGAGRSRARPGSASARRAIWRLRGRSAQTSAAAAAAAVLGRAGAWKDLMEVREPLPRPLLWRRRLCRRRRHRRSRRLAASRRCRLLLLPELRLQPLDRLLLALETRELRVAMRQLATEPIGRRRSSSSLGTQPSDLRRRGQQRGMWVGRVGERAVEVEKGVLGEGLPPRECVHLCLEGLDQHADPARPLLGRGVAKVLDDVLERLAADGRVLPVVGDGDGLVVEGRVPLSRQANLRPHRDAQLERRALFHRAG
mmetsp:Transcript_25020/g.82006  ORF Transcript_25020/g.82006 Transcript_25020/m.82006 type:complete len:257 (+) Transcript_25020:187-957(+)